MSNIILNIANEHINLNINYDAYEKYVRKYLDRIIVDKKEDKNPRVYINIENQKELLSRYVESKKKLMDSVELSSNTVLGNKNLVLLRKTNKKCKVVFNPQLSDEKFIVNIILRNKTFYDSFRYSVLKKPEAEWFYALNYYIFYYPLFWYLEYKKSMFQLHAAALAKKDKGLIIFGLEGSGKTTFSLMFLKNKNFRFLSDNLILFDEEKIYPCYEALRIGRNHDQQLWKDKFEKIDNKVHLKEFFRPKVDLEQKGIIPEIIIFLEFSKNYFCVNISPEEAIHRAITLSYLPSELRDYIEYRNIYNLLDLNFYPWEQLNRTAGKIFRKLKCYRIGIKKIEGLDNNFNYIKENIYGRDC